MAAIQKIESQMNSSNRDKKYYSKTEAANILMHKNVGGNNLLRILKNEDVKHHPEFDKMFKTVSKTHKTGYGFTAQAEVLLINDLGLEWLKKLLEQKYPEGIEPIKRRKTLC